MSAVARRVPIFFGAGQESSEVPLAIAVDLGGTKIEACLVDDTGALLPASRTRTPTGPHSDHATLRSAVTTVVDGALAAAPSGSEVIGVGVGSAGPIDTVHESVSPLNLPGAAGFPLVDAVRGALPRQIGRAHV